MPTITISKRKLESYRRAEVVAQASRQLCTAGANPRQELWDNWSAAILDWMDYTGKLKYAPAVRRSRKRWGGR